MAEYSKTALIVKVAKLYFEVGMSQAEIAQELDISRSYVSRLLTDAKEQGIVSIAVRDPEETESALEKTIRQHYGLRKVIVSGGGLEGNGVYEVAKDAAKWLNSTVKSGDVIGIGWGRTLYLLLSLIHIWGHADPQDAPPAAPCRRAALPPVPQGDTAQQQGNQEREKNPAVFDQIGIDGERERQ